MGDEGDGWKQVTAELDRKGRVLVRLPKGASAFAAIGVGRVGSTQDDYRGGDVAACRKLRFWDRAAAER